MTLNKDICSELWKYANYIDYRHISKAFNDGFIQASKIGSITLSCNNYEGLKYLRDAKSIFFKNCAKDEWMKELIHMKCKVLRLSHLITDNGVIYANGLHTLFIHNCNEITHVGLTRLVDVVEIHGVCVSKNLDCISELKNIKSIEIRDGHDLTDNDFRHIPSCVQKITIRNCPRLSGEIFKYLKNVRDIDAELSQVSDKHLEYLKDVQTFKLSEIYISSTRITDEGLKCLKNAHTVGLSYCRITDEGLKYLENVQTLELYSCEEITNKGFQYLKNIRTVRLLDFENITHKVFKNEALRNVRTVTIGKYFSDKITDEWLKYLKHVHTLDISNSPQITDEGVKYLKNVHTLNISGCYKVTDKGIKYLKNVHTLNISGCFQITDKGAEYLKNVNTLNISGYNHVTHEGLKYLKNVNTLIAHSSFRGGEN